MEVLRTHTGCPNSGSPGCCGAAEQRGQGDTEVPPELTRKGLTPG